MQASYKMSKVITVEYLENNLNIDNKEKVKGHYNNI